MSYAMASEMAAPHRSMGASAPGTPLRSSPSPGASALSTLTGSPLVAGVHETSDANLPPLLRALVSRSRASSRPTSASAMALAAAGSSPLSPPITAASPLATTQEVKLGARAAHQAALIEQRRAREQQIREQQQQHQSLYASASASVVSDEYDGSYTDEKEQSPSAAAETPLSPSAAAFQRDLGPLYSQFQSAAQRAQAVLASGFPGGIRTAFERTSYWKRAPPTRSEHLGTLAWLFLHYALPPNRVSSVRTLAELEADELRLSFRGLLFLAADWKLLPQLSSKAHLAMLYHRFGGVVSSGPKARIDVGLTYAAFIRVIACVALAEQVPASSAGPPVHSSLQGGSQPASRPMSSIGARGSSGVGSGTARDKALAFLSHLRWDDQEVVSSGLERLRGCSWYRLRNELPDAKSVFVHKPTCLVTKPGSQHVLRTQPCAYASAPDWAPLEEQILVGLTDKPSVLHLDPHHHAAHALTPGKKKGAATKQRPTSSPGLRTSPASASSSMSPATSFPDQLSKDELRACTALRTFDRLPLESSWCAYPGPYVDMGVIEVLPPLESGASSASPTARSVAQQQPRDPSALAPQMLRPHRYTLRLQNRSSAGLKVSISSEGCEWLGLQYDAQAFLSMGMQQQLKIRAPTHMPPGLKLSGGSSSNSGPNQGVFSPSGSGAGYGLGQGVERLGHVVILVQNSWTYAVSRLSVPIYARLVLQGTSGDKLQSLPRFQPVPSVPQLMLPQDGSQQQQGRVGQGQADFGRVEVEAAFDDEDEDEGDVDGGE